MPRYDFLCANCYYTTEVVRTIAQRDDSVACVNCGKAMDRLAGAPGFSLQGPGFHQNDYGGKRGPR